jgi:hypothetical protein
MYRANMYSFYKNGYDLFLMLELTILMKMLVVNTHANTHAHKNNVHGRHPIVCRLISLYGAVYTTVI